jgi:hypothetical protein
MLAYDFHDFHDDHDVSAKRNSPAETYELLEHV